MRDILNQIKSYNDLRKHFPRETFQQVMTYIAWHNRLTMTPIITVPQALTLAVLFDGRTIDTLHFTTIRDSLTDTYDSLDNSADCHQLAGKLVNVLELK